MKNDRCLRLCVIFIIFSSISFWGCGSDDDTDNLLRVRVVNQKDKRILNATVVLGNPDGSMVTFGTTDAIGIISFRNPPSNATVTAAIDSQIQRSSYVNYSVVAEYDVNISAVTLKLFDYSDDSQYGTLNVNVTDGLSGIDNRAVSVGGLTLGGTSHSFSLYVDSSAFQSNGKISVVAVGYDEDDSPVGYGLLLDQIFSDELTVDVTINKTGFGKIEYLLENIPESAIRYVLMNPITRKEADTYIFYVSGETPGPQSVSIPYILDFGESYKFISLLSIDRDGDGTSDSEIWMERKSLTQSDQVFDFGNAPEMPSDLTFSMEKPGCPTISWTGSDISSQFIQVNFSSFITSPARAYFSYSLILPPSRTSIVFPELPETLAAFRPNGYQNLNISTYDYDIYSGYDDYLRKTDMYYSGTYKEPAESAFAVSETGISKP